MVYNQKLKCISYIVIITKKALIHWHDALAKFEKLIDVLEDLDDVQQVYHNVELPDEE